MVEKSRATRIIDALNDKGATKPCPRCGHLHFGVVAETAIPIDFDTKIPILTGGPVVPTVIIACNNCGFVTQHALGALGLSPEEMEVARAG